MIYAIPDIHGRNDLLLMAFDAIDAHAGSEPATIITLGDYVDRGPQGRQVIETLMKGARRPGDELVCLAGNHEEIMVVCLAGIASVDWWISNGGALTLISYGHPQGSNVSFDPSVVPPEHIAWIQELRFLAQTNHHVFVHAGVRSDVAIEHQARKDLLWMRYPDGDDGVGWQCDGEQLHVVHGHEIQRDGPLCLPGRTGLDTNAWATGKLYVGVFDPDKAGGPVELLTVEGPTAKTLWAGIMGTEFGDVAEPG